MKEKKEQTLYGWICPRCGTVHAPFVRQCDCPIPTRGANTGMNWLYASSLTSAGQWDYEFQEWLTTGA